MNAGVDQLAPTGILRAAINVGNPAAAQVNDDDTLGGLSVELATALADFANIPVELIRYSSAGAVMAALDEGWDLAFLAIDPARMDRLHFTTPYLTIEAGYATFDEAPLGTPADIDKAGVRIASARGAAYDLMLGRTLVHAQRVMFDTPEESRRAFVAGEVDVLAGIAPALRTARDQRPGTRIVLDPAMRIEHAMVVSKDRPHAAALVDLYIRGRRAPAATG